MPMPICRLISQTGIHPRDTSFHGWPCALAIRFESKASPMVGNRRQWITSSFSPRLPRRSTDQFRFVVADRASYRCRRVALFAIQAAGGFAYHEFWIDHGLRLKMAIAGLIG